MQGLRRLQRALMGCLDRLEDSAGAGCKDERLARGTSAKDMEKEAYTTKPKGAPPLTTVSNYSR